MLRRFYRPPLACFAVARPRLEGQVGLEIGGPSVVFAARDLFPVYPIAARIDNTNFSAATVWEGEIAAGRTFRFDPSRDPGFQFLLDATGLAGLASAAYDFVLSSHALEHVANPLQALAEWRRVVRPGGTVVVIVPHRDATFDHRRPVTTLEHLRDDFARGTPESDLTHLPEILALHDLALDPGANGPEAFASRSRENVVNRCLHHHTFTTESAARLLDAAGFRLLAVEPSLPFHIVIVAERPRDGEVAENSAHFATDAPWRRASPFLGDRGPRDGVETVR